MFASEGGGEDSGEVVGGCFGGGVCERRSGRSGEIEEALEAERTREEEERKEEEEKEDGGRGRRDAQE